MTSQAGAPGTISSAEDQPLNRETLDAVLDWCLAQDPPIYALALDENGLAVPMPSTMPMASDRIISGVESALEVCSPDDLGIVVDAWQRARRTGGAQAEVHLRLVPDLLIQIHFVDARERYGVYLVFFVGNIGEIHSAGKTSPLFRPRLCALERNELSVICAADDAATKILGWSKAELVGRRTLDLLHPDDRPFAIAGWMEMLARPSMQQRALSRYRHRDGHYVWLESSHQNKLNDPASNRIVSHMIDVSDRMEAIDALRANERLLRRLTEALPIGIVQIDAARRIVHANERLGTIVGVTGAETIEAQFALAEPAQRGEIDDAIGVVLKSGYPAEIEVTLEHPEGRRRCSIGLRALTDEHCVVTGAIACIADITESVRMREELKRRATFDDLTRCYNRAATLERLELLLQSDDAAALGIAVLFVDLDRFKETNDELGHAAGDALLRAVGERLFATARPGDLVGRLGGDEFLIVCRNVETADAALAIAHRVAAAISQPTAIGRQSIVPTASIGVVWTTAAMDADADKLVARADAAMYESKRLRTGPVFGGLSKPE
jgi:diguanylate cyclase (GGDEF)-like protein/PAS domain S-box-containing protein